MKLAAVLKLDKSRKTENNNVKITSCQEIVTLFSFFQFMVLDAKSVKLMFSLIATFYLIATQNRTKKPLTQLSYYYFE